MIFKKLYCVLLIFFCNSYARNSEKIVYCFTNYDEESFWLEKGDYFKKIFEPQYVVKFVKDLKNLKDYAYIITLEIPHDRQQYNYLYTYPKKHILLFSFEGQITHPLSHDIRYHDCYSKVFTWNDNLIDNQKYFKTLFPYSDPLPLIGAIVPFSQKKLVVLMGTNNIYNHPIENYSGRKNIIEFFEKISYSDFEFYGYGWSPHYKNYRGFIEWDRTKRTDSWINFTYSRRFVKINVIKNYKFDIVYENCKDQNGYLTERIFDTFAAGCVPVYWGSTNIHDYIPKKCMIMRNDFHDNYELYNFLRAITEEEYAMYQQAISDFLVSHNRKVLSTAYFIDSIKNILKL